jgi:hypothetical protein
MDTPKPRTSTTSVENKEKTGKSTIGKEKESDGCSASDA